MNNELYDCCIVGTGAAGGILAHRLASAGLKVISIEQGDELEADYFSEKNPPGVKKWYGIKPKTTFPPNVADALFIHDLFADHHTRSSNQQSEKVFRQFQIYALNGLQNLWNGVSVRFSETDFSTWPIRYLDIAPHYSAVERRIGVCGTQEKLDELPDGEYIPPKPLRPADHLIIKAVQHLGWPNCHAIPNRKAIETRMDKPNHCASTGICTFGCPVGAVYKFSARLLPLIRDLPNYTLLLNAKVIRLICNHKNNQIQSLEYLCLKSRERKKIRARFFILSAGAIETPRILFHSHDPYFPQGLANQNGTLGWYLQDNPKVVQATSLYKLWFNKRPADIGYGDLLILLGQANLPHGEPFRFIGHSISAPPDVPYYLADINWLPRSIKPFIVKAMFNSFVTLGLFCEGDLLASNRIKPSDSVDNYGIPQVDIHYTSSETTLARMKKMAEFGRKVLRRASSTHITEDFSNDGTGIHYAGTSRMGNDEKESIVDANLKTFAHNNLYLCDGGVIPHLPDKHLTLTIMALADRLATHLINEFQTRG
ncbi:GMC family oxidoreductase [Legionella anisa]|uniref:GMC family oxidoreductase n=1 Tax=Legionella anisa TaxID=28082 RepID=A0AAX0WPW4_9GAMM|nr:GMC family oxidoreductase [Legionella anisa]AWN73206.1 GMC family oxidoreductase [Legionella anisa]KTC69481.1 Paromamine 6'-oxidase [Legionella anisa]MBN5934784.1 GMC family oxidoreductase [Legionella anisa]MCW8424042.1 GMC family oxidoreductase [Legionella anisa]MCW8447567.1 GMC family oxidoreductase [Legionella anisa]